MLRDCTEPPTAGCLLPNMLESVGNCLSLDGKITLWGDCANGVNAVFCASRINNTQQGLKDLLSNVTCWSQGQDSGGRSVKIQTAMFLLLAVPAFMTGV